ncbi:hypothetical protein UFOVP142_5 [uncultured Caudovirales phage]|uniref:Uncharacterized protein n=1 Tax=uncultured Caudovirales phage TaxID=2100421 RepID=A0A6J7XKX9_9CAUD|nr:hypothetical protein UFOVP142_5 [uncultured Caudovirales phage]
MRTSVIKCKKQVQRDGETRHEYLKRAARAARRLMNKYEFDPEYAYRHSSFLVDDCLHAVEEAYNLGTYGAEVIGRGRNRRSPEITYLNTGNPYGMTIMYIRGKFRVGDWGDIVERGNYE